MTNAGQGALSLDDRVQSDAVELFKSLTENWSDPWDFSTLPRTFVAALNRLMGTGLVESRGSLVFIRHESRESHAIRFTMTGRLCGSNDMEIGDSACAALHDKLPNDWLPATTGIERKLDWMQKSRHTLLALDRRYDDLNEVRKVLAICSVAPMPAVFSEVSSERVSIGQGTPVNVAVAQAQCNPHIENNASTVVHNHVDLTPITELFSQILKSQQTPTTAPPPQLSADQFARECGLTSLETRIVKALWDSPRPLDLQAMTKDGVFDRGSKPDAAREAVRRLNAKIEVSHWPTVTVEFSTRGNSSTLQMTGHK